MTANAFLAWTAECHDDTRYELVDGIAVAMAPEQIGHADVKGRIFRRLAEAIEAAGLPCQALVDGAGIRVSEHQLFIPDVLVRCRAIDPAEAREVSNPLVVVEVSSPSTAALDHDQKFQGYFTVLSVRHYLIVHPGTRHIVHHERRDDGLIVSRIAAEPIYLDPPGIVLAGIFPEPA